MIGPAAPDPISLEEAVQEYVVRQDTPFTTDEALPDILDGMTAPPSDAWTAVDEELLDNDWVFYDEETDRFIPRRNFFRGSQFLITPQPEEIEANILIPGHRFMPFVERDVFPATCRLFLESNDPIPCRVVHRPIQDLLIYLSFYGQHGALQYLTADQNSNHDILNGDLADNPEFAVTVFDMTDAYAQHAFKAGDAFLCTVKDWARGIYDMEYVPSDPDTIDFRMQQWIEDMDAAICMAWEEGDYFDDIYTELSEALFLGPKSLYNNPPLHFGGFLARSKKVVIDQTPLGVLLSHKDYKTEGLLDRAREATENAMTGRCESLDAILNDIGLSTTKDEIEAYMRHAYAQGARALDVPMGRAFAGREGIAFFDDAQISSFTQFIEELWESVSTDFNPKRDKRVASLRARVLDMLDRHTAWLRDCDRRNVPVLDLPEAPSMALASMTGMFSQILGLLNRDEDTPKAEMDQLTNTLDLMEERFDHFMLELEGYTSGDSSPELRILPELPPECMFVYQLKVTLKGIRPPIWRRLHVLGETTLEQLHLIIQVAMGWGNYHLHDFEIYGIRYGITDDDDLFELEDIEPESETYLCQFATEGMKFKYTYDYGDGWEHSIEVEKLLPPDEDLPTPRCIKAKRACPPEDCGGPWGYQNLLKILNDPTHPDHATFSEWVPPNFTPEEISLPAINTQLKSMGY